MNRLCNCSSGGTGLALLVSLAMGSWAYAQCANDAGGGDTGEGETCLVDHDDDTVSGGCNSSPAVFVTLNVGDFTLGVVEICGIASNYNVDRACDVNEDCPDLNCVGDPNPGDGTAEGTCVGAAEPSSNRRDTDWYMIPQAVLTAHDADLNGVVQINSTFTQNAELDLVTFLIGITDPAGTCDTDVLGSTGCNAEGGEACDVNDDCPSGNCVGDPVPGDGNADGLCSADNQTATETLIIADYPDGVVVFAAPGECDGAGIFDGFECSTGNNDYILEIRFSEAPTACQPGPPQGPCNEPAAFGVAGCEDPGCCATVCSLGGLAFCCINFWSQACATAAIDQGCAPEPGGPVLIATGPDSLVEGYLQVKSDPYGAWSDSSFGGTPNGSDQFNPDSSGDDLAVASFANGFFMFLRDTNQRELLCNLVDWQEVFGPDDSLDREITSINLPSDTDGDTVFDQLNSQFHVTGAGVDLTFNVQQNVKQQIPLDGTAVSTIEQTYVITNNLASPVTFVLLRNFDGDLVWQGSTFSNDSVGTATNGSPGDRYIYMMEAGVPNTAVVQSSPLANAYVGSKATLNPDPNDPNCPDMGAGTDTQDWDAYGVPDCWRNYIANVGYNTDGDSGPSPGADAHTSLELVVTVPGTPGPAVTVEVLHTYGQASPYGQAQPPPCPWDCESVPSGEVDIADFLAILAQWDVTNPPCDGGGNCDIDGNGCVDINDFLAFLGHFGPCPTE
jgi:hypothetical protein